MNDRQTHVRHGFATVRPYVYGHPELAAFVKTVFGARELELTRNARGGVHVELRLGDSVVVLETMASPPATVSQVVVYVEDVDATYARALAAGGRSLQAPEDKPYQERGAGIVDPSGNTWWLSTWRP